MRRTQKYAKELIQTLNGRLEKRNAPIKYELDVSYGKCRVLRRSRFIGGVWSYASDRLPANEVVEFVNGLHTMLDDLD